MSASRLRARLLTFGLAVVVGGCGASQKPDRAASADEVAARAQRSFEAGDSQLGIELATRALVLRIARHGIEHRESARSFLQLGDMRYALGQRGWARQSYVRGLEVLAADRSCADRLAECFREKQSLERSLRRRLDNVQRGVDAKKRQ